MRMHWLTFHAISTTLFQCIIYIDTIFPSWHKPPWPTKLFT